MEDSEFDLYDDLDEFNYKVKYEEAQHQIKALQDQLDAATKQIDLLNGQKTELQNKIDNLERSFHSLLLTARSEIKRKDAQLADVRKEKDDLVFRRQKQPHFNKQNQFRNPVPERHNPIGNASNEAFSNKPEDSTRNKYAESSKNFDKPATKHQSPSMNAIDIPNPVVFPLALPPPAVSFPPPANEHNSCEKQTPRDKTSSSGKCENKSDPNFHRSEEAKSECKSRSGSREKLKDLDRNIRKNDDARGEHQEHQRTRSDHHERDPRRYKDKNDHRKYESRRRSPSPARRDDLRKRDHKGTDEGRRTDYQSRRDSRDYRDRRQNDWTKSREHEKERDRNRERYHENRSKDNEKYYHRVERDRDRDRDKEKYTSNRNESRSHKSDRIKDDRKTSVNTRSSDQKSKTRDDERYRTSDHKHARSPHESSRKGRDNSNQDGKLDTERDWRKEVKYTKPSETCVSKEQQETKEGGGRKRRLEDDREQGQTGKASSTDNSHNNNEQDLKRIKTTNSDPVHSNVIEAFTEDHLQALKKQLEMELKDEFSSDVKFSSDEELDKKMVKTSSVLHSELSNDAKFSSDEDKPIVAAKQKPTPEKMLKLNENIESQSIDSAVTPAMECDNHKNNSNKSDYREVDMELELNLCQDLSNTEDFACFSDSVQKVEEAKDNLLEAAKQTGQSQSKDILGISIKHREPEIIATETKTISTKQQLSQSCSESKQHVVPEKLSNVACNERMEIKDGNLNKESPNNHKKIKSAIKSDCEQSKGEEEKASFPIRKEKESPHSLDKKISPKTSPLKNDIPKKQTNAVSPSTEIINISDSFEAITNDCRTNNDNRNNEMLNIRDPKPKSEEKIEDSHHSIDTNANIEPKKDAEPSKRVDEENANNCASHSETSSDSNSRGSSSDSTSDESTSSGNSASSSSSGNNESKQQEPEETKPPTKPIAEIVPNSLPAPHLEVSSNASTGSRFDSSVVNHKNAEENDEEIFETPIKLLKYKKHLRPQQQRMFCDINKTLEKDNFTENVCEGKGNKKPEEEVQSKSETCNRTQNEEAVRNESEKNDKMDAINALNSPTTEKLCTTEDKLMSSLKRKRETDCEEISNKRTKNSNAAETKNCDERKDSLNTVDNDTQMDSDSACTKQAEKNSLNTQQLDSLEKQLAFEVYGENVYEEMAKDIPIAECDQSMNLSNDSIFGCNETWKSPSKAKNISIDRTCNTEIGKDIVNQKILNEIGLEDEDINLRSESNSSRKEKSKKGLENKSESKMETVSIGQSASGPIIILSPQTSTENKLNNPSTIKHTKENVLTETKDLSPTKQSGAEDKITEISNYLKQSHENLAKNRQRNASKNKSNEAGPINQPKTNLCIYEFEVNNKAITSHQKSFTVEKNESRPDNYAKQAANRKTDEKVAANKNSNQGSGCNRANLQEVNKKVSEAHDDIRTQLERDSNLTTRQQMPNLPVCNITPNTLPNIFGLVVPEKIRKEDVVVTIGKPLDDKSKCRKTKPADTPKSAQKPKSNVKMIGHIIEGFEREPSPRESNLDTSRVLKQELFKEALGITTSTPLKSDGAGQSKSSDGSSFNESLSEMRKSKIVNETNHRTESKMIERETINSNDNSHNKTTPNVKARHSIDVATKQVINAVDNKDCVSETKTSNSNSTDKAHNKIHILDVQILQGCALNKPSEKSQEDIVDLTNTSDKSQTSNNSESEAKLTKQSEKNQTNNKEILTVLSLNQSSSETKETKSQTTKIRACNKDGSNAVKKTKTESPEKVKVECRTGDVSNKDLLPQPNRNRSSKTKETKSQGRSTAKRHETDKHNSNLISTTNKCSAPSTETKSNTQNSTEVTKTTSSSKHQEPLKSSKNDLHLKDCDITRPDSNSVQNQTQSVDNVAEIEKSSRNPLVLRKDAKSDNLLKPIQKLAASNESNSPNSSIASQSQHEKRNISIASTDYLIEKVDNNVVNVFITRKKTKKKKKP